MSKLATLVGFLLVAAGTVYYFQPELEDAYLDYKAEQLVGKCYQMNDLKNMRVSGAMYVKSYNKDNNTMEGDAVIDFIFAQLPLQLRMPRNGVLQALESGELTVTACQGE